MKVSREIIMEIRGRSMVITLPDMIILKGLIIMPQALQAIVEALEADSEGFLMLPESLNLINNTLKITTEGNYTIIIIASIIIVLKLLYPVWLNVYVCIYVYI